MQPYWLWVGLGTVTLQLVIDGDVTIVVAAGQSQQYLRRISLSSICISQDIEPLAKFHRTRSCRITRFLDDRTGFGNRVFKPFLLNYDIVDKRAGPVCRTRKGAGPELLENMAEKRRKWVGNGEGGSDSGPVVLGFCLP